MSASEKLRALEREGAFIVVGSLDDPPLREVGDTSASVVLRNALPQIVAVVEAAESVVSLITPAPPNMRELGGNLGDLRATLAALDEALT